MHAIGGRFLRKIKLADGGVVYDEVAKSVALEKCKQALRENWEKDAPVVVKETNQVNRELDTPSVDVASFQRCLSAHPGPAPAVAAPMASGHAIGAMQAEALSRRVVASQCWGAPNWLNTPMLWSERTRPSFPQATAHQNLIPERASQQLEVLPSLEACLQQAARRQFILSLDALRHSQGITSPSKEGPSSLKTEAVRSSEEGTAASALISLVTDSDSPSPAQDQSKMKRPAQVVNMPQPPSKRARSKGIVPFHLSPGNKL